VTAALVSIVVPVYNGAAFLQECLASIAAQTYQSWNAVVVNNCSTDGTAELADAFAREDPRFRVVHCTEFLSKTDNYNRAISFASDEAEFVKMVEADNYLWPESIQRMVDVAGSDPEIGIVSSYYVQGGLLLGGGVEVRRMVLTGDEVRRHHLLTDAYYLGVPSTLLFRAKALSEVSPYFRPGLFCDDVDLCFRILAKWKFGIVHQVLAFVRDDNDGVHNSIRDFDFVPACRYVLVKQFGADVLEAQELAQATAHWKRRYLARLGRAAVGGRKKQYWEFHKGVFRFVGEELDFSTLLGPVARSLTDALLNPKSTTESLLRRQRRLSKGFVTNAG
jgi:glycosyltransferase involved in cell wall biosynthesis